MPSPAAANRNTHHRPQHTIDAAMVSGTGTMHTMNCNNPAPILRTLIVDNYDSYTFNLLQLFDQDQLENVVVIRNDQIEWSKFEQEVLPHFDQIVLSPGPGRPERIEDFGICTQILQTTHIPVFGVCLGHQGIGWTHGGKVTYGPEPVHGQIAHIKHDGTGLFEGVPNGFEAVRYHSLVVQEQDLPSDLIATAWCHSYPLIAATNNNTNSEKIANRSHGSTSIMGLRHRTLPHHGVQFHPESICTKHGKQMMSNFFRISQEFYADKNDHITGTLEIPDRVRELSVIQTKLTMVTNPARTKDTGMSTVSPYSLRIHALDSAFFPDPEVVFESLFLTGPRSKAASWWLDSARQPHPMSRFSFMGGVETRNVHRRTSKPRTGASQAVIQYSTLHKEVCMRQYSESSGADSEVKRIKLQDPGDYCSGTSSFWDWMSTTMATFGNGNVETTVTGPHGEQSFETVPFDFFAGMIGYFSYEMKRESLEGYRTPSEQQCHCVGHSPSTTASCNCDCSVHPDASFFLATQAVVFDHVDKRVYVLGLVNNHQSNQKQNDIGSTIGFNHLDDCEDWIKNVTDSIVHIATNGFSSTTKRKSVLLASSVAPLSSTATQAEPYTVKQRHRRMSSAGLVSPFKIDATEDNYLRAIQDSLDYIHEGESYELCLTTQFRAKIPLHPHPTTTVGSLLQNQELFQGDHAFDLYKILRKLNPAPFSAFLSVPLAREIPSPPRVADDLVEKLIILSSSPERFLKIGQKPKDDVQSLPSAATSSRTVEMKPIKGTVAVAKGCFCKEDEGCSVDEHDDDNSEHNYDEDDDEEDSTQRASRLLDRTTMTTRDRCAEARQREDQRRIDSLSKNIKERAENLMIVDLIRNDLAHVCGSHSVRVPYLMHVESYETVHQLVTTVRGELFDHVDNIQAVRACFPPGSMTGAPKLRSVQLLDSLEHHVKRGVYSGCLGYIGIPATAARSNCCGATAAPVKVRSAVDMAVVIRTAVLSVEAGAIKEGSDAIVADVTVGAGGALTILSDPKEEWREVLLKSRSVVPSVMAYMRQQAD
ncbi:Protein phosphatase PP2A regulatory subunit B [Gryganskiella cystojenkinii]|nr:Protein phosphatase PP2A regulatory subunit B [Gryganskiella cystojenkinii]